ncbi:1021_t:CDS:2, partial [Entrophospora sp. SA101]
GWISNFKKRNNIKEHYKSGEAASAPISELPAFRTELQFIIAQYELSDVYNADETSLYWKLEPHKSLASGPLTGLKKPKDRITYVEKNFSPHLIATGHYTEVVFNNEQYYLSKPKDKEKDQTYFLCQVNPMLFKKIIFLLANLTKQEVRQLALHLQLVNAKKKDSTGICFIGKRKFDKFLANYLTKSVGKIIDVDKKKIIGQHQGTPYYTIGQWRNLGLAGHCTPYYLVGKNDKKNLLYVSQGRNNK